MIFDIIGKALDICGYLIVVEHLKDDMKNNILILLMMTFLWSCTSDNFYETQRYFKTDKNSYQIGEEFRLTVFIMTEKDEKEIRLNDNYKNLKIWFTLMNAEKGIHNRGGTKY